MENLESRTAYRCFPPWGDHFIISRQSRQYDPSFTRLGRIPLCRLAASEWGYPLPRRLGSQATSDLFCRCIGHRTYTWLTLGHLDTSAPLYFFHTPLCL